MSRKNPKVDRAKKLYLQGMKLIDIAALLDVSYSTVRRWKSAHSWETLERSGRGKSPGNKTEMKTIRQEKQKRAAEQVRQVLDNSSLNDRQRLFCLYYTKSFNATQAYRKAYPGCAYATAASMGCKLLKREAVKEEIFRLKQAKMNRAMLEPEDIFQKYMEIAFSDMVDYVEFGREEIAVTSKGEPVLVKNRETGEPEPLMKEVNVVRLRESDEVDGSLISEISQGKDGAKIRLADKMKALDWLTRHMDMATEEQKAKIDLLNAQKEKLSKDATANNDAELTITVDYEGVDED